MSNIAIMVQDLGKRYNLEHGSGCRDSLVYWIERALSGRSSMRQETPGAWGEGFWALRHVGFEVGVGEVVGLLGPNGAGKSTLMKLLARTIAPTEGTGEICGRIGTMLDIGTGFHSDLSGRENIFMAGTMLGMSRSRIAGVLDDILEFSEIDGFLDLPVRQYSSGMFSRLAFSVAAHLDAEIMLLDEALSVGDAGFQRKALAFMKRLARSGRTVMMVSHDTVAIREICDWCIVLDRGQVHTMATAEAAVSAYNELVEFDSRSKGDC